MTLRKLTATAFAFSFLTMAACDVTDPLKDVSLKLDVDDAPIELAGDKGSISVVAGQAAATTTTVSTGDDIQEVSNITEITLKPSFFTFASTATASGISALTTASGSVQFLLAINGIPVPSMPVVVSVANSKVTTVTPQVINLEQPTYNKAAIEALYAKAGASLPANWSSMTPQQAVQQITAAISSKNFPLSLIVFSEDLTGTLKLGEFTIDARVASTINK